MELISSTFFGYYGIKLKDVRKKAASTFGHHSLWTLLEGNYENNCCFELWAKDEHKENLIDAGFGWLDLSE